MNTNAPADLLASCRRLFLRGYEVPVRIGVHAFEQDSPQRIIFNVDLYVPFASSTPTKDDLNEVVDYDFIREVISERVSKGHIGLQETLCDEILSAMIAHPKVVAACVSTEKPDVYPDCQAIGVEVFRRKH
ncbi:MAG: dihydroneopterin aldolase [Burkholderiales bacterium]|nr:dihydroneopterin aldolase [Burkholderiales bacterium]